MSGPEDRKLTSEEKLNAERASRANDCNGINEEDTELIYHSAATGGELAPEVAAVLGIEEYGDEKITQSVISDDDYSATATGRLYPEVTALLGLEECGSEKVKRSVVMDAAIGTDTTLLSDSVYRSAEKGDHTAAAGGLDDVEENNNRNSPQNNDNISNPPSPRGSSLFSSISHVSSVRAVPMHRDESREQSTMPDQISDFREPPMAQAVPVPMEDQPEPCTTGVLYHKPQPLSNHVVTQLIGMGYTTGLVQTLNELKACRPIRFWLVDNSGSMLSPGGCEIRGASGQEPYVAKCTRWAELKGTVAWHAGLAGVLESHTVFRLVNAPENVPNGQEFAVADRASDMPSAESVKQANCIMNSVTPRGFTPLTAHVKRVRESIQAIRKTLENRCQQAVVVIATDGLPTDDDGEPSDVAKDMFENALKSLQPLPVWLVVRLCTDDPDVMAYYNGLDRKLEWNIDVIDDYRHEAKQIFQTNPWLNYALPLHRCREMGLHLRVVDLLDERLLDKDELLQILKVMFGGSIWDNAPDIQTEWKKFVAFLQNVLESEELQYNPLTKRKASWIDIRQLNKCYGENFRDTLRDSFHAIFKSRK